MANLKDTIVLGDLTATGQINASRIEPQGDKLYIGKDLYVGMPESQIRLFTSANNSDNYSALIGFVEEIPASTWMKVATAGNYGTILVIGANWGGARGGFVAMATNSTLHVSYKSGCVTNVRMNSSDMEIYTNADATQMRILYLKAYD